MKDKEKIYPDTVISNIKLLIRYLGISQVDFANRIGLSPAGFHKIMSNGDLKLSTLYRISKEFDKPIAYFFSDDGEERFVSSKERDTYIGNLEEVIKAKDKIIEDLQFNMNAYKLNYELLERRIELINECKNTKNKKNGNA